METPKKVLEEMKQRSKIFNVIMPEHQGYGYEKDNPIEVLSPHSQINYISQLTCNVENATNIFLSKYMRTCSKDCSTHDGLVDEYEIVFCYDKAGKKYVELFVLYFCFYPKKGESYTDFVIRINNQPLKYPEGLLPRQ